MSLGLGDPQQDNRGCYGIDLNIMIVSNQRYNLTETEQDPTGGVQTLFCVFGLKIKPQIVLVKADESFTREQIDLLVTEAKADNFMYSGTESYKEYNKKLYDLTMKHYVKMMTSSKFEDDWKAYVVDFFLKIIFFVEKLLAGNYKFYYHLL